jgi:hypothetical protein
MKPNEDPSNVAGFTQRVADCGGELFAAAATGTAVVDFRVVVPVLRAVGDELLFTTRKTDPPGGLLLFREGYLE